MNFDIKNNISIEKVKIIDQNINSNLELLDNNNRGFISQNILAQLRNYVETILVFYYGRIEKKCLNAGTFRFSG